jgi:ubiquinone/menaquinone biosynthesis C-methylase UbiE
MGKEIPNLLEKIDDFLVRYFLFSNYGKYVKDIKLKGKERILEVGCGGGNLSRFIVKQLFKGEKLVCIDISSFWLGIAKKRIKKYRNVKFKLEDITNSKLKNSYFDIVVIHYVLHDIPKNKREYVIKIIRRKLKKKGKIYIREPTRKNHGVPFKEIDNLMASNKLKKIYSKNFYHILLRQVYEAVFIKE